VSHTKHIELADAAGLAALGELDAERMHAEAHARTCTSCADMLNDAAAMLQLLDAGAALPAPDPHVLERCQQAIHLQLGQPSATTPAATADLPARSAAKLAKRLMQWPAILAGMLAAGLALALVASGKHREPALHAWAEAGVALVLAIACLTLAPRLRGAATALAVAIGAGLVVASTGSLNLNGILGETLGSALGLKCALIEIVVSALPFGLFAYVALRNRAQVTASSGAAIAAAGALAGQAALHLTCPERSGTPHLLVFHLGAVAVAAVLGSLAALPLAVRIARLRAAN
jgi:hypothetical protein